MPTQAPIGSRGSKAPGRSSAAGRSRARRRCPASEGRPGKDPGATSTVHNCTEGGLGWLLALERLSELLGIAAASRWHCSANMPCCLRMPELLFAAALLVAVPVLSKSDRVDETAFAGKTETLRHLCRVKALSMQTPVCQVLLCHEEDALWSESLISAWCHLCELRRWVRSIGHGLVKRKQRLPAILADEGTTCGQGHDARGDGLF